jgi:hypothetical protein
MDQNSPKQKSIWTWTNFRKLSRRATEPTLDSVAREPDGIAGIRKALARCRTQKPQKSALLHL